MPKIPFKLHHYSILKCLIIHIRNVRNRRNERDRLRPIETRIEQLLFVWPDITEIISEIMINWICVFCNIKTGTHTLAWLLSIWPICRRNRYSYRLENEIIYTSVPIVLRLRVILLLWAEFSLKAVKMCCHHH